MCLLLLCFISLSVSLSVSFNSQAGVFMGFSITSAVFGGIIIICYSLAIAIYGHEYYYYDYNYYSGGRYRKRYYDKQMALAAIILILGIVEFVIGIWASVCVCVMKPCQTCCNSTSQQQVSLWKVINRYVIDTL